MKLTQPENTPIDASTLTITIAVSTFNTDISEGLLNGTIKALTECKVSKYEIIQIKY